MFGCGEQVRQARVAVAGVQRGGDGARLGDGPVAELSDGRCSVLGEEGRLVAGVRMGAQASDDVDEETQPVQFRAGGQQDAGVVVAQVGERPVQFAAAGQRLEELPAAPTGDPVFGGHRGQRATVGAAGGHPVPRVEVGQREGVQR